MPPVAPPQLRFRTIVWLGELPEPIVLLLFCCVGSVMRVIGMPETNVLVAPCGLRETADTVPDAAPPIAPALSPLDIGMIVAAL
ncbi:hypothetical protein WG70_07900 [Burkholderia oklahomensis EO147]|nr:hypothetical protein WG70_07900 [Burkholderia oklahomensis EO147]AOI49239.1 hypothetical protein WI23_25975 [Burkholderia oklahomensis C6786]KUY51490.1 hypothetical protein WG70_16240 [Burkholderia oklahomensis EO147]KUY60714.1 hypothetical protein WI23_13535 [Burkholderia oklahomensis C6786]